MNDTSATQRVLSTATPLLAVLDGLGVRDAVQLLDAHETEALLGIIEAFLAQATDFVARPDTDGWVHEDRNILMGQGHTSALVADVLRRFVVPALGDDLTVRLDRSGGSFLDVGAGVAALSVAMCRLWPSLHVVGIDPWEPALDLAREQVAAADLQERIELLHCTVETLADSDAFDLAWVPTFFIPDPSSRRRSRVCTPRCALADGRRSACTPAQAIRSSTRSPTCAPFATEARCAHRRSSAADVQGTLKTLASLGSKVVPTLLPPSRAKRERWSARAFPAVCESRLVRY